MASMGFLELHSVRSMSFTPFENFTSGLLFVIVDLVLLSSLIGVHSFASMSFFIIHLKICVITNLAFLG